MITIYKPRVISSIIIIILITAFSACKKDSATKVNIVGKWSKSANADLQQYEFRSNSTYQSAGFTIDPLTSKVLGYRYKSTGKYRLNGQELTLYNNITYSNPDGYGPETDLVKTNPYKAEIHYRAEVSSGKLSLFFSCGPTENCIPSPIVYSKQ